MEKTQEQAGTVWIRRVLAAARDDSAAQGRSGPVAAADRALAELAAIEQAARQVVSEKALEDWNTAQPSQLREAIKLFQAIAKGEP